MRRYRAGLNSVPLPPRRGYHPCFLFSPLSLFFAVHNYSSLFRAGPRDRVAIKAETVVGCFTSTDPFVPSMRSKTLVLRAGAGKIMARVPSRVRLEETGTGLTFRRRAESRR